MTPKYPGKIPSNTNKDAKYSIRIHDGEWQVSLVYRIGSREEALLTTDAHPELVEMVNHVKVEKTGKPGGAFYINEYMHVIVPTRDGGALWAGTYGGVLEFAFDGGVISPVADGLDPGDPWMGPHVGSRYVLAVGGKDIKYKRKLSPTKELTVLLSDEVEPTAAAALATRLAAVKGEKGGRIYINERAEFFSPPAAPGGDHVYLGHLDDDDWFPSPEPPATDEH